MLRIFSFLKTRKPRFFRAVFSTGYKVY